MGYINPRELADMTPEEREYRLAGIEGTKEAKMRGFTEPEKTQLRDTIAAFFAFGSGVGVSKEVGLTVQQLVTLTTEAVDVIEARLIEYGA